SSLPTTSDNGITGVWSLLSSVGGRSSYLFTPTAGQCASTATTVLYDLLIVSNDTTICEGGSAQLLATGGGSISGYTWSPATGLSATNIANPVATPSSTTTYTVSVERSTMANLITNPSF